MKIVKCDICYTPYETEASEDFLRVCDECSPKLINLEEAQVYKILRKRKMSKEIQIRMISGLECAIPVPDGKIYVFFISVDDFENGVMAIEAFLEEQKMDMDIFDDFLIRALSVLEGIN